MSGRLTYWKGLVAPLGVLLLVATVAKGQVAQGSRNDDERIEVRLDFEIDSSEATSSPSQSRREALVVVQSLEDDGKHMWSQALSVPGTLELPLLKGGRYEVTTLLPGHWTAPYVFVAAEASKPPPIRLLPSGTLAGKLLTGQRNAQRPAELTVHFQSSDYERRSDGVRGEQLCPVQDDGTWSCKVPAGVYDYRLKATGFASAFRWEAAVEVDATLDLGPTRLRPGAALFGRVETEKPVEMDSIEITLEPLQPQVQDPTLGRRLAAMEQISQPDERGFFHFRDVVPGTYRIAVSAPRHGALRTGPVRVMPGLETDLGRPLILRPPSTVRTWITPPSHPTHGSRWRLTFRPIEPDLEVVEVEADDLGFAQVEGLSVGEYVVHLGGPDGARWGQRRVALDGGVQTLQFDLPLIAVEGTLTRDGDPVRARLTFGNLGGELQAVMYSDFEGRFQGHLPHGGEWPLRLLLQAGGAQQLVGTVTVESKDGGPAELDIEVADTVIWGRVLDHRGLPVSRATIHAQKGEDWEARSRTRTDEEGRFEMFGLPPGAYTLTASKGGRSTAAEVDLEERPGRPVTLTLGQAREIRGRVVGPHGPLAGVQVKAIPELAKSRVAAVPRAVTDPLGEFQLRLPSDTRRASLLVLPFGHAAQLLEWRADGASDSEWEVTVGTVGGTLEVPVWSGDSTAGFLASGEAAIPLGFFTDWLTFHGRSLGGEGDVLEIPALAPGTYRLCRREAIGSSCDAGALQPGSRLSLRLPDKTVELGP